MQSGRRKFSMRRLYLLFCLPPLFGASKAPACHPEAAPGLARETVRAAGILDGGVLLLPDGRKLLLSPVAVPRPAWRGRKSIAPLKRLAARAGKHLTELAKDRDLVLAHAAPADRYGRLRAQAFRPEADGSYRWLQGEMVREGFGRVETGADTRQCAEELLRLEAEAREQGLGIWRLDLFAVRGADEVHNLTGSWQIVEGRIRSIAEVRGRVYMNFGEDWRRDFTISIGAREARRFPDGFWRGKDGHLVRVRGQVEWFNGPMIEATHPEQLEWPKAAPGAKLPSSE
jgi:micrococcal nuclease